LGQSAERTEPRERALDHSALGQDSKAVSDLPRDKSRGVVIFVGTDTAVLGDTALDHFLRSVDFGAADGQGGFDIDNQAVAVLGQGMGDVTQLGLGVFAFLV
jgi:hypothetical protein